MGKVRVEARKNALNDRFQAGGLPHAGPEVAASAALRARPSQIDALHEHSEISYTPKDPATYRDYCRRNCLFHQAITQYLDNPYLEDIVMSALDRHQPPACMGVNMGTDQSAPSDEHRQIVAAIESKDVAAAEPIMLAPWKLEKPASCRHCGKLGSNRAFEKSGGPKRSGPTGRYRGRRRIRIPAVQRMALRGRRNESGIR